MDFTTLVKTTREQKHSSAAEFFREAKLPCSYYYYSKIESGTHPEVELAIAILKALGINLRKGLYAWVRGQMPDKETKAFFTEMDEEPSRSSEQHSVERSLVINRMQARLLESDPVYWEILLFISTNFGHFVPSEKDIIKHFKLPAERVRELLTSLYEHGLVDRDRKGAFKSKEWLFIPYDQEFESLREVNFRRALKQFLKEEHNRKFRSTITRLLTKQQAKEIEAKVVALTNAIVDMPEEASPPTAEAYTVGVFAGPRRFGDA